MAHAEKGLQDSPKSSDSQATDFAWLEILNNATQKVRVCCLYLHCNWFGLLKVTSAEKEKRHFEQIHQNKAYELNVVVQEYNTTERKLRSTIRKIR